MLPLLHESVEENREEHVCDLLIGQDFPKPANAQILSDELDNPGIKVFCLTKLIDEYNLGEDTCLKVTMD